MDIAGALSWFVIAGLTLVLPFVVQFAGKDAFRLPKQLWLEGAALILACLAICGRLLDPTTRERLPAWNGTDLLLMAGTVGWTALAAITSTNISLSTASLSYFAASLMVFVASYNAVAQRGVPVLYFAFIPAVATALIALAQRARWWNPFAIPAEEWPRMRVIGFLGNPNDVGMFMVAPAVVAAAVALVYPPQRRIWPSLISALCCGGILLSETRGAVAAVAIGLFVLLFRRAPRMTLLLFGIAAVVGILALRANPTRWAALRTQINAAARGDADRLMTGRLPPALAAIRMFRQHPILGVGPGAYPFHYFDEKLVVEAEHPVLKHRYGINFGEAHNDHLQVLAETGCVGYAIFLGVLARIGKASFGRDSPLGAESAVARNAALPLALSLAVLAMSAFPLRLAAPTESIMFISATLLAWSRHADS